MTTSFCSAATSFCFPKELKLFINDSDSKENENKVDATGWMLTIYVQQSKIYKIANDSDS